MATAAIYDNVQEAASVCCLGNASIHGVESGLGNLACVTNVGGMVLFFERNGSQHGFQQDKMNIMIAIFKVDSHEPLLM